ncbi:unnamed protein product [Larinioides sclopetarius]|uniref:VWFC domain-containing protein n=2 Tax=Larinioides sclopetarius TaxID=280406 RepID=A0AAV2AE81_9ARAC
MWEILTVTLLSVSGIFAESCDLSYYQHYQHKGCTPVAGEDGCPVRYQCPTEPEDVRLKCLHNNEWYRIGEKIRQDCESCTCKGDEVEGAYIDCAAMDCPDWEAKDKSCYMGYDPGACCPREMCHQSTEKACNYNGSSYKIGQIILTEDPCKNCVCTENGPHCKKVNCLTGIYAPQIREGCLPIYGEKGCCLSQMHCEEIEGAEPVSTGVENTDHLCEYRGVYYEKGATAALPTESGVECKCVVPPDFTCLRKSRY